MTQSFSHERWNSLLKQSIAQIEQLSTLKGGEYAGDTDRLANFRRNGVNLGLPMESIWAVYAGKHWDALMQFIKDQNAQTSRPRMEPIEGRVDDLLVYLLLFKAMLWEQSGTNESPSDIGKDLVLDTHLKEAIDSLSRVGKGSSI